MSDESVTPKRYMMELRLMRAELLRAKEDPAYAIPIKLSEKQLCIITYALAYLRLAEEVAKNESYQEMVENIGETAGILGKAMQAYEPDIDWDGELERVNDAIERRLNAENN